MAYERVKPTYLQLIMHVEGQDVKASRSICGHKTAGKKNEEDTNIW